MLHVNRYFKIKFNTLETRETNTTGLCICPAQSYIFCFLCSQSRCEAKLTGLLLVASYLTEREIRAHYKLSDSHFTTRGIKMQRCAEFAKQTPMRDTHTDSPHPHTHC